MTKEQTIYDSAWKYILDQFFPSFIRFFFPEIYDEIDWERGHEFLDKEFQKIVRAAKTGKRYVDKLIKIFLKTGEETWVLFHVEAQAQPDLNLPERMYIYNSLIYLRYRRKTMSIAILGDNNPNWRPTHFEYTIGSTRVSLQFSMVKLLDIKTRFETEKQSKNPFHFFVEAHLRTLETRKNYRRRSEWKFEITKRMIQQGMDQGTVDALFQFIDYLMVLPEHLEEEFMEKIDQLKEEENMPFVAPYEKIIMKRGVKQGLEQGSLREARDAVFDILNTRFMEIPYSINESIQKMDNVSRLRELRKLAITTPSLDEFKQMLKS
ncbi:MAG: hypothetical protein C4527_00640 [Candidatus Omnitrophota bacterium]|jgi:hypothetical protein|nr:MAG: hypothetical protein C4527_00640 [Candidatus Omnitrophota bacterium]